jgi:uncharacterized protein
MSLRNFMYVCLYVIGHTITSTAQQAPAFRVIGFFTAKNDQAHISFVHEANKWLVKTATENNFAYDSTSNWSNLNKEFLSQYHVVVFLDTRPEDPLQREAFKAYMENGGAWLGFHFAAFALTPSTYPQNWDWYHQTFLGAGQFKSNTWRPTSAILRVEDKNHAVAKNLPETFKSCPSEWYRWENDIRKNPDIRILMSVDSTSFPLGTGPKQHEIWLSGYYPIVWTNTKYRMVYMNMGHNDIDYENKTNRTLSSSFECKEQNVLIKNALLWLGNKRGPRKN